MKVVKNIAILLLLCGISLSPLAQTEDKMRDLDFDGIPDIKEAPGETYKGLPLYDWGARPNQTDIFIEIDYMDPVAEGYEADSGIVPMEDVLHHLIEEFHLLAHNTNNVWANVILHFDVGSLFGEEASYSIPPGYEREGYSSDRYYSANFNLGGGGKVPYSKTVEIKNPDKPLVAEKDVIEDYYKIHMADNRKGIFYYMLFANMIPGGGSGQGQMNGTVSVISLGQLDMHPMTAFYRQYVTIAHELGHNFGLHHGGGDSINNKLNYPSVMNYEYLFGRAPLVIPYSEIRGFASQMHCESGFNYDNEPLGPHPIWRVEYKDIQKPDTLAASEFMEHYHTTVYSNGRLNIINENSTREEIGYGQSETDIEQFDLNCNGLVEENISFDINNDGLYSELTDFNDWGNLYFYFHHKLENPNSTQDVEDAAPAFEFAMPPF